MSKKKMIVIEVCRTARAWTRVYKNMSAYNRGAMLLETASRTRSSSDRQLVRSTLKTMAEIGLVMGFNPPHVRDQIVILLDDDDKQKIVKMFV